jgi:hypothetical protein
MKHAAARLALMSMLALMPLAANAVMSDAEAAELVRIMLEDNKSATDIIETLMEDGRSLQDATVIAVENSEGHAQFNLARVGICLAEDARRAEEVGRACVDACEPDSKDIIESLIEGYVTGACDPPEYEYSSTPTGGGSVSPST